MKIIGFNKTRILAEKGSSPVNKLDVEQKINIKEITKEKMPFGETDGIKISFSFIIAYSNNSGKLEFEGSLLVLPEGDEIKKFEQGMPSAKIPEDLRLPLFNFIMNKCTLRALSLEEELSLPLHIQMPKLSPPKK
jgi:hypothetical protein